MLETAWRRGWLTRPTLDPDALVAAVVRSSGVRKLDDGCWRKRLDVLAAALRDEAALNPLGTVIAHGQLTAALLNRARLQKLWERHPEIGERPLAPPILIVGQMRSGSTRIQRLLACDPRLTFTRFFESWNPLPRYHRLPADRAVRAWLMLRCAHLLNPDFRHIHPTGTMQADEEVGLQNVSIFGSAFEAQWRVPSFAAVVEATDDPRPYAEFRRLLQTVAWFRRHEPPRRWVLKLPQFSQDLGLVLAAFPDAAVVHLDRDPAQVTASSASLVYNQMEIQSDKVDPFWVGQEWLRKTRLRQERARAALARSAVRRVALDFAAVNEDWRGEISSVYRMLGMPLTQGTERRMDRFIRARPHRKLSRHSYDLADFGLSQQDVERVMRANR